MLLRNLLDRDWNEMTKQFRTFSIKVLFNKFIVANLWNATKQKIQSFSIKNLPLKQILILIILILVQNPLSLLIAATLFLYLLLSSSNTFEAIKARFSKETSETTRTREDYCNLLIKILKKIQEATETITNPLKEMFLKFIEPILPKSTSARFICFILIILPFVFYKVIGLGVAFQIAEKASDSLFDIFETIVQELSDTCSDLYKIYVVSAEKSKDLWKQVLDLLIYKNPIVCIYKKQRPEILNCFDFLFEKANNSTEMQMGLIPLSSSSSSSATSNILLLGSPTTTSSSSFSSTRPIKVPTPGIAGGVTTSPTPSTDWKKCLKEVFLDFNLECAKKLLQEGIVWCEKNIVSLMLSPPIPVGIYNVLVLIGFVTVTILNYISKTRETGKVMFEKSVQEIVLSQSANDILRTFSGPVQALLEPCRFQESVLTGKIKMESFYGAFDKFEGIDSTVLSTWLSNIAVDVFKSKEREEEQVTVLIDRRPTRVSPFCVTYFNNKKWKWPYFLDLSEGEFDDDDDEEEFSLEYLEDQKVILPEMIFSYSSSSSSSSSFSPFRGRGQILGRVKRPREQEKEQEQEQEMKEDENLLVLEQVEYYIGETRTRGELGRGMKSVDDLTFYLELADFFIKKTRSPFFKKLEHIPVTKRDKARCILALAHANNIFSDSKEIKLDSESFKQCTTLVTGRMSIVSFILQIAGIGILVENSKGTFLKQRDKNYLNKANNLLATLFHFKEKNNVIKKLFKETITEDKSLQLKNVEREIHASDSSDDIFFPEFDSQLDRENPYKSCYRLFLSLSREKDRVKRESFKRYCRFIGFIQIIFNETINQKRQDVLDNFLEHFKLPVKSLRDIERYNFFRPFGENIYFTEEEVYRGPNEFNCLLSERNINKKTTLFQVSKLDLSDRILESLNEILLDHPGNDAFSNKQTLVNFLKMLE